MSKVSIKNVSKTVQVFNLSPCASESFPDQKVTCKCTVQKVVKHITTKDGTTGKVTIDKKVCGSLTLQAGETTKVEAWVLSTHEVKNALKASRKVLVVVN